MSLREISTNLNINTASDILTQLDTIIDNSTATISQWGTRKISYKGEEVSFTELAANVDEIARSCRINHLDEIRREQWISISEKISFFYDQSDAAVKQQSFITRLFTSLREFNLTGNSLKFFYQEGMIALDFRTYTRGQLLKLMKAFNTIESSGSGDRHHVPLKFIQKKAAMDRQSSL